MVVNIDSGSGNGYEYRYRFSTDDDIIRRYSPFITSDEFKFLFEFRTSFSVRGDAFETIIDSERFELGATSSELWDLHDLVCTRLEDDYWLSIPESIDFARAASAFASQWCNPDRVIPIAVELDVCTVKKPDESIAEANDRAMRSDKLFPLSLMYERFVFVNMKEEELPYRDLVKFLRKLEMDPLRVCFPEFFPDCSLCRRSPKIGDQYIKLDISAVIIFISVALSAAFSPTLPALSAATPFSSPPDNSFYFL